MTKESIHTTLTYFIASVWFINGFFCKILNLVPRHEQIVARILGNSHSQIFTILIGLSEILMTLWVLTRIKSKFNAIVQIVLIAIMNSIEFVVAPDLLLWGKLNAVFAFVFIVLIFYNEFILNKNNLHTLV